jgi:hypothetical protein
MTNKEIKDRIEILNDEILANEEENAWMEKEIEKLYEKLDNLTPNK